MKKTNRLCIISAFAALLSSCVSNDFNAGEGTLNISANIDPTVMVIESRAITDENALDYLYSTLQVWISKDSEGKMVPVRQYLPGEVPTEPLKLITGNYLAEAWAGDSVSASWDKKYFKAAVPFSITDGNTTTVKLDCKIANVAASVEFSPEVLELLDDYTLELGHKRGHLTFDESNIHDIAYFMMPSNDHDISWTLTGKKVYEDNALLTVTNVIENVKPGYQYVFKITCASNYSGSVGGTPIKVKVDEKEIIESKEIAVNAGPIIQGYKFDIDQEQVATPGTMAHKNVWIFGAKELKSVVLDFPESIINTYGNGIDVVNATATEMASIESRGISVKYPYYDDEVIGESESVSMKILFDDDFTMNLAIGEYDISISATDGDGITCQKTLRLVVKDDAVEIYEVDVRTSHTPKLTGHIIKSDVDRDNISFTCTELASGASKTVPATVEDDNFYARVEGLKVGATYQYVANADGFSTKPKTFVVTDKAQLPNAGFEGWQTSSSPYLIYAAGDELFWDSGNHGSATMSKNVTVPDSETKHSGVYSVKLASQFVGIGSIGKFAAGNVFIGKYLGTEGTDGIIGFGRQFACAPTKIRCYVKYRPVAVTHEAKAQGCNKGDMDTGIIYAALLDDTTDSEYPEFPVVVKTKTKQLFDKNAANVIAYAEWTSNAATDGEGMIQIEIPFDYYRTNTVPTYLMLTASASKYGDYFAGGNGSNMWLDDVELVYE